MDIKQLNLSPNPLSDQIVENGDKSFRLWLEFEESSPWSDLENNYAIIGVNMLDGRRYALNVWTHEFFSTALEQERKEGKGGYVIPPDLFVQELTRSGIEKTIKALLHRGRLEEILNPSVFSLSFNKPYEDAIQMDDKIVDGLMNELQLELSEEHPLYNESYELLAKKMNNDDIVLVLNDGRIAVVCLSWTLTKEKEGFPKTRIYANKLDFWEKEMRHEVMNYKK